MKKPLVCMIFFFFSLALAGGCAPVTSEQAAVTASSCNFAVTLPERYAATSSTISETELRYRLINRGSTQALLRELAAQLEQQGWVLESEERIANSAEFQYRCAQGSMLHVKLSPVGRSFIYLLQLNLIPAS